MKLEPKQLVNESRPVTNLKKRNSIQALNAKQIINGMNSKAFNIIPVNKEEMLKKCFPSISLSPTSNYKYIGNKLA